MECIALWLGLLNPSGTPPLVKFARNSTSFPAGKLKCLENSLVYILFCCGLLLWFLKTYLIHSQHVAIAQHPTNQIWYRARDTKQLKHGSFVQYGIYTRAILQVEPSGTNWSIALVYIPYCPETHALTITCTLCMYMYSACTYM